MAINSLKPKGKMEKKQKLLGGIFFLAVALLSLSMINAAVTINTPAASGTVTDATIFNLTVTDTIAGSGTQLVNITFYAMSVSTANSSWSTIGTNNSMDMSLFSNETINSINLTGVLEDSNDYIFNATVIYEDNSTFIGEDTNIAITVDQTTPTTPTITPATDSVDEDGDVTFTAAVTGTATTSCTLNFPNQNPGSLSYTMAHSGDACTYSLTDVPEQIYEWYVTATDGTDTATSSTNSINIDVQEGSGQIPYTYQPGGIPEQKKKTLWFIGIVVVVFLTYWLVKKK